MAWDRFFPPPLSEARSPVLAAGVGPFVVILTMAAFLGLGYVISEFAKRFSGAGRGL